MLGPRVEFSEAALRGIDLKALRKELPTSRESRRQRARHEKFAKKYWDNERLLSVSRHRPQKRAVLVIPKAVVQPEVEPEQRVSDAPAKVKKMDGYSFTDAQLAIALAAMEKRKK